MVSKARHSSEILIELEIHESPLLRLLHVCKPERLIFGQATFEASLGSFQQFRCVRNTTLVLIESPAVDLFLSYLRDATLVGIQRPVENASNSKR